MVRKGSTVRVRQRAFQLSLGADGAGRALREDRACSSRRAVGPHRTRACCAMALRVRRLPRAFTSARLPASHAAPRAGLYALTLSWTVVDVDTAHSARASWRRAR